MADTAIITDAALLSTIEHSRLVLTQCTHLLDFTASAESASSNDADLSLQISKQQKLLNTYLAQLRGLNRDAIQRVRNTKHSTAEARQEIDRLHLQLQNLYYEQRFLRGEIAACESYDHKYTSLPLVPVPDFLAQHPEHAQLAEDGDENGLMIARINHEHAEREALEQARQGLLKKKQGLIADNKKRKEDLASLDGEMERFIDAAKPIQKTFEKEY
ncbi:MAG: hypothetical protein M4579_003787 [Chaenotheca gracillima]|nr:MAG: hypothetical protein M4579_003787 [Chaenotheca gracillima]